MDKSRPRPEGVLFDTPVEEDEPQKYSLSEIDRRLREGSLEFKISRFGNEISFEATYPSAEDVQRAQGFLFGVGISSRIFEKTIISSAHVFPQSAVDDMIKQHREYGPDLAVDLAAYELLEEQRENPDSYDPDNLN